MEKNSAFTWTDFHETCHFSVYRRSVDKTQVLLQYGENNVYFTWRPMSVYDNISLHSS